VRRPVLSIEDDAMTKRMFGLLAAVAFLLPAGAAQAHHSFAAEFDAAKPITLRGTLTKIEIINPHGWIYVDVKNPDGTTANWAVEAGSANALLKRGLRKESFPVGTEVVIKGFLAKNGRKVANGQTVTLPDGRDFFLGSSGTPGAPDNQ
jgi:hypothetical protein